MRESATGGDAPSNGSGNGKKFTCYKRDTTAATIDFYARIAYPILYITFVIVFFILVESPSDEVEQLDGHDLVPMKTKLRTLKAGDEL